MKKELSAICFDADGVVVYPQLQFSKYLNDEHGISPAMTRSFFHGVFNNCLVGKIDLREALPDYLNDWAWKGSVDEFIAAWLEHDHVVDARLILAIQHLRESGVLCCLTTSQERNRADYMRTKMGFQAAFDHLFFSCEVGYQKPDHAYYQLVENTLDLEKASILFLDDAEKNVIAARECGWNAEVYTEFGEFEQTLRKYDVAGRTAEINKMDKHNPEMTSLDVIEIVKLFKENQMDIIIDGGWSVDALLGKQTRRHQDLDVAVNHQDVPQIRALLEKMGFLEIPRQDAWECNFVLGDRQGHLVDLHSCTFDEAGDNIFGVPYPFESWNGAGSIEDYPVRCITPEWIVKFHTGYPVDENDYQDIKYICQCFGIEIPQEYDEFVLNDQQP